MPDYLIRIRNLGVQVNEVIVNSGDSLSAINYHIANSNYPMIEYGLDKKIVVPAYEFEARLLEVTNVS